MINALAQELSRALVIKHTFFELVEEEEDERERAHDANQRAFSAPAAPVCSSATDAELTTVAAPKLTRIASPERACEQQEGDPATKTTVVVRNLPQAFKRQDVMDMIDGESFFGCYDFFYLPIDSGAKSNFGYAFVNLLNPEHASRFIAHFDGFCRWGVASSKATTASWSRSQGFDDHVECYRNRPIMHDDVPDECKPVVLKNGVRVPFPTPTKKVRAMRRLRTRRGWKPGQSAKESPLLGGLEKMEGVDSTDLPTTSAGEVTESEVTDGASSGVRSFTFVTETKGVDETSECSTWSSKKSGLAAHTATSSSHYFGHQRGSSSKEAQPTSMLAGGLTSTSAPLAGGLLQQPGCMVEVLSTGFPAGQRAIVCGVDTLSGTYSVQLLQEGFVYGPTMKVRAEQVQPVLASSGADR